MPLTCFLSTLTRLPTFAGGQRLLRGRVDAVPALLVAQSIRRSSRGRIPVQMPLNVGKDISIYAKPPEAAPLPGYLAGASPPLTQGSVVVTRLDRVFPKHQLSFHRNKGSFSPRGCGAELANAWHKQARGRWLRVHAPGGGRGGARRLGVRWGRGGRPTGGGCCECFRSPPPVFLLGRRDSSGIRLYYTAALRRFDAGIMELGLVYSPVMAIPPRESSFILTGYCTDKCTQVVSGAGRAPRSPWPWFRCRGPTGGSHSVYTTCRPAPPPAARKTKLSFRE